MKKENKSVKVEVQELEVIAEVQENTKVFVSAVDKFYKDSFRKVEFEFMQDITRYAHLQGLRLGEEITKKETIANNLETQLLELEEQLEGAGDKERTKLELDIWELKKKIIEYDKELNDMYPIQDLYLELTGAIDYYVYIKAYALKFVSQLPLDELLLTRINNGIKNVRKYIEKNKDTIEALAQEKKTADTKNLYVALKNELQEVVNILLSGSDLSVTIKPCFVSAMCGMVKVEVKHGKDTNLNHKNSGVKVASEKEILHTLCKLLVLSVEPQTKAEKIKISGSRRK